MLPGSARGVVIIPSRYGSTRLPGKPLALIAGRPMVVRVVEQARQAQRVERVIVATDDPRIQEIVREHGGEAVLTPSDLHSGTDRVAWVAAQLDAEIVVNVQGDEPLIAPESIDAVLAAFDDPSVEIATAAAPLAESEAWDTSRVKVVTDHRGRALYFSRAAIPHGGPWRVHVGLYGFRRPALLRYAAMPPSPLERSERLEQLRLLENGVPIHVVEQAIAQRSVDTVEDLDHLRALLEREH